MPSLTADRVHRRVEQAAGLQVEQLAGDVDAGELEVVLALAARERLVELAGLGVDEVGGERRRRRGGTGCSTASTSPQ